MKAFTFAKAYFQKKRNVEIGFLGQALYITSIKNRLIAITIVLMCISLNIYPKSIQPVFNHYTIREGLSHNTVNSIVQDSLYYMWFGTMDGLNRFDGYNFKVFKSLPNDTNSLCHNLVKSICIDQEGGMWIGTARGLSHLDITSNTFTNFYAHDASGLSYNNIEMVFCDSRGTVWVATMGGGLNKLDKETRHFTCFNADINVKGSLSNDNVHWIFEDHEGILWVGTEGGGLNRLNRETSTFDYFQFEPRDGNYQALSCVRSIQEDNLGNIWVGTWGGGAAYMDKKNGRFKYFRHDEASKDGISDNRVISILAASNSQIWLGTEDGGLNGFNFKSQNFQHIKMDRISPQGLKSNNIKAIYEDRMHRIWLGSSGEGIFSFHSVKADFSGFRVRDENTKDINNQDIYAIAGDGENFAVGTNGAGLYHTSLKKNKRDSALGFEDLKFEKIALNNNIVHALCYDNWGRLWAGTLGGGLKLIEFTPGEEGKPRITNFNTESDSQHSVSYNDIRTLHNDKFGNVWIGTAGGGLDKLVIAKRGEYYFEHYKHNPENISSLSNNDIRAITDDKDGNIWIGTSFGLNKMMIQNNKVRFKTFYSNLDSPGTLSGNWINSLYVDINGLLWIGTDAGLNSLDTQSNKITVYTEKDGLANNVIKAITGDQQGNLWITTVNGLSMFNLEAKSFYNFYEPDGLLSNEFNTGAVYTDRDGHIILGGTKGLNYFTPKGVLKQNQVNDLHLTNFKIFNQPVNVGQSINGRVFLNKDISVQKSIRLKHNENSFSFEFSALDYSNAEKIKYQYKLEGFNKNWQETDAMHRFATYTNLGGGNYTFKVKAFTGVPGDSVNECQINLTIDYPIWFRWWSFIIYTILLVGIILIVRHYFRNKAKYRDDLKMANIQREKEQELIKLKQQFFMNISHDLKTPLTLILGPLERILQNKELADELKPAFSLMKRNALQLSRLITQLMDYSKQERGVLKLQVRRIDIIAFLNDVMYSFQELASQMHIHFSMDADNEHLMAWIDEEKIEKVVFNLLSNAFKYTPSGGAITIRVRNGRNGDELLYLDVEDTGKGIDRSHHARLFERFYQADKSDTETGTGIGLSLVKEFVLLHHGAISVKSEVGIGSRFSIQIPLSEDVYSDEITCEKRHALGEKKLLINDSNRAIIKEIQNEESKPSVLVVEDNNDMCSYLKMILSDRYRVTVTNNGQEGLKVGLQTIPDLIISDVMMPKMDGITFCNQIKNNLTVCHVPVLLLTAKSGKQNTLSGLGSGADDYIEKPFDTDIFLARIQTLLDNRNRVRQQLQKDPVAKLSQKKITRLDRKFLADIEKIVLDNLTSENFSVEELGRQIGMSRTTLYRKTKGLIGQTPIEHIRTIRLKEALRLMQHGNDDIVNIAETVGFKDVVYFKNCFKKQFEVMPEQV
ncbi:MULTISPECIES: hybrid sensor histidine kinase/response regulator transcription factor [unclassified Saccharicrinis]|uniref:hybrid sensor histidine kinase/response regulator transcription factor n=1 Tax=unclassified Saccharicrinis TaxID=2646859 RepID=UPI003D326F02